MEGGVDGAVDIAADMGGQLGTYGPTSKQQRRVATGESDSMVVDSSYSWRVSRCGELPKPCEAEPRMLQSSTLHVMMEVLVNILLL